MKKNLFQLSLLFSLCIAALCGCAEHDEPITAAPGIPLTIRATAGGFTAADGADTRASESNYTTNFTADDAIGVFAVKNGAVIADCKNVKCTYDATTQTWTADATIYYYTGATYFAYYPYESGLSTDGITDVSGIVDYFNKNITTDQGSYDKYTACDLMTATAASPGTDKTLSFNFEHKMSLIEIALPVQKYKTSEQPGAYEYSFPVIGATFSIVPNGTNGTVSSIIPYNISKGVYRCIIPAGTSYTVSGEFVAGGNTITYSKESLSLSAGNYKRLNVTYNGAPSTSVNVRPLAVGDFYYSDGSIVPGTTDNPPVEGCIGVIYCVDNSFITSNSTKKVTGGYTHALVVALKDASTSSTWHDAGNAVSSYQNTVAVPSNSSDWYWPNWDELKYICWGSSSTQSTNGKTALNTQFEKLNTVSSGSADGFGGDGYWSSSEFSGGRSAYNVAFDSGNAGWNLKIYYRRVRCSLAF